MQRVIPAQSTFLLLLLVMLCATGCVSRRLTIHSDPVGALVKVNGKRIGFTPVSTDFIHYGTYEISLEKDGYEPITALQKINPPWYQRFPLDFVSDNFLLTRVTNRHRLNFEMTPRNLIPANDSILDRANAIRSEAQIGP